MKKIIFSALMCLSLVSNAFAGGYLEAASKYKYTGWACDPDTPNYAGWVHLWRDDGIFLGALPANHNREPAVAANCGAGDAGVHGFSGEISFPNDYLDNQTHIVRAYFIRQDESRPAIELLSAKEVLFDGGPQPYFFKYQTSSICNSSTFASAPGWLLSDTPQEFTRCGSNYMFPRKYVFIGDPNIPVGSQVEVCSNSASIKKMPDNWQIVSVVNSNTCLDGVKWTQVGNNNPRFHSFRYSDRLKIKKVY
ncbi:hypothetical protein ACSZND_13400 [Aeromonas hydrophila]|jgi:hypothetical protein|uniref:hypothetical protein n=1 Tax=Aeromonas TaxID=642 RepID=UPI000A67AD6D|nr:MULTISPECIES: hypothetical protein [Aeromonas]MBW3798173.1 hypothetical protein [Aeromonas hydrophila]MBW3803211.1 hypothetical protein [Aeromonas hydrophila]MBW3820846.1 hypothetical protein [Aeromonas hydrophila]MCX4106090.1 hypothetical protein [Aeromonas hydrophila]GJC07242.1 hypothetical protein KAM385_42710 [Aeromonas hydrophila]